jgi:hypothetical protein
MWKTPPPKDAVTRQLTLINASPWHDNEKFFSREPQNDFEKFMEAFWQCSDRSFNRLKCQGQASAAWKQVKGDNALLARFLATPIASRMGVLGNANVLPQRVVATPAVVVLPPIAVAQPIAVQAGALPAMGGVGGEVAVKVEALPAIDSVGEFLTRIGFPPDALSSSKLMLKTDFAAPLKAQASNILREWKKAESWEERYNERIEATLSTRKEAPKLNDLKVLFQDLCNKSRESLLCVCQRKKVSEEPGSTLAAGVAFSQSVTDFEKTLGLLLASAMNLRKRLCES